MNLNSNEFDKICRTCLMSNQELLSVTSNQIFVMLEECASADVSLFNLFPYTISHIFQRKVSFLCS